MVTVIQDGNVLMLHAHYAYKDRLKALPGAGWNYDAKMWQIPIYSMDVLEERFEGELFYKTPRWVITGDPMPDMSDLYEVNPSIQAPPVKHPYKLYDYQEFGARFIIDRISRYGMTILADGCGLGKTSQAISVMEYMSRHTKHMLIICKKSIKHQWEQEIRRFGNILDSWDVIVTEDTPKKKAKNFEDALKNNTILITNYQTFLRHSDTLAKIGFGFGVVDECHIVASYGGKMNGHIAHVLKGVPTLFMTGTPIQSRPEQVYGIVSMANRAYFGNYRAFLDRYVVRQWSGNHNETIGAKNLDELREKIQNIMLRRTIYEVSVQFPDVMEQNVKCAMDAAQKRLVKAISEEKEQLLGQYNDTLAKIDEASMAGRDTSKLHALAEGFDGKIKGLIAAAQAAADDPRLFHLTRSKYLKSKFEDAVPANYAMSPKNEYVLDKVTEIVDGGEKVIIFSKFVTSIQLLGEDIAKALGIEILYYTGLQNAQQREENKDRFLKDPNCRVFICSEAACEGLNLNVTCNLINYNLPDTAALYTQRVGRVRRVGSTYDKVMIYNTMTEGSKDESRWENIQNNKRLEDAFINIDNAQRKALKDAMDSSRREQ